MEKWQEILKMKNFLPTLFLKIVSCMILYMMIRWYYIVWNKIDDIKEIL